MCRPPALEVCNGMDDNGNGMVDEGLRNDDDADGFFTCDADPTRVDCVDRAGIGRTIYPGAPELCDGYDNDCNPGTTDGSAPPPQGCDDTTQVCARPVGGGSPTCLPRMSCRLTGCGMGEYCDSIMDRCVLMTDCTMAGMGCLPGERCNTGTRMCEPIRDLPIGEICRADIECASRVCYSWDALDLPEQGDGIGRCGAPCCDASSCSALGTGLVCWAPGTGARSCMPGSLVDTDAPTCVRDCPGGDVCRLSSVSTTSGSYSAFTCGPAVGSDPLRCSSDADCVWGLCSGSTCTLPCGSQEDCAIFDCVIPFFCSQVGVCGYYERGGDWVTACAGNAPSTRAAGATCTGDAQCQELYCHASTGRCSATCCANADCAGTGEVCRPVDHFGWEMRCVPLPPDLM
jgi:hypothetical protein